MFSDYLASVRIPPLAMLRDVGVLLLVAESGYAKRNRLVNQAQLMHSPFEV